MFKKKCDIRVTYINIRISASLHQQPFFKLLLPLPQYHPPNLQPTIDAEECRAFIPFSISAGSSHSAERVRVRELDHVNALLLVSISHNGHGECFAAIFLLSFTTQHWFSSGLLLFSLLAPSSPLSWPRREDTGGCIFYTRRSREMLCEYTLHSRYLILKRMCT